MVWNPENCQHDFAEADVLPCTHLLPINSSVESPTLSGHSENNNLSDAIHPISTKYPESFTSLTSIQCLTNNQECATGNGVMHLSQYTIDSLSYVENQSWQMDTKTNLVLDNVNQNNINTANPETNCCQVNEDVSNWKSRRRQDSTDSIDSSSSGEIFNSHYTDTVSSVGSDAFLLKPSADSDEELPVTIQPVQEIYFNDVYMSCSSSEMLNETESDDENVQNILSQETSRETDALLEICIDEQMSRTDEGENNLESQEDGTKRMDDFIAHALIPIDENQVITFNVEEIQPTESCVKITNNVITVDESFLFHSNTSLWDLETGNKDDKRAVTMQNLHERSSFLDLTEVSKIGKACQKALLYIKDDFNFGSLASLNNITNKQLEENGQSLSLISGEKGVDVVKSTKHTRNLLALSFCLTLFYIAIGSVRNLQSSINHEGGVGVLSMATNFIGYLLGSMFSPSIVLNFQPRKCIIVSLIPNVMYIAANIYPAIWIMMPISFIQGVSMSVVWNAVSTYVILLSRGRSQKKGESVEQVSSRFFGILCLMYQSHLIIGNLIASLVLMPVGGGNTSNETLSHNMANVTGVENSSLVGESVAFSAIPSTEAAIDSSLPITTIGLGHVPNITGTTMSSICGSKFCYLDVEGSGFAVSDETKYLLFGIYIGCMVISLLIAVFLLEPLNPRLFSFNSSVRPVQKLKSQLSSLMVFFVDIKFLLLVPMLMYSVIQFAFITAEFTKAFVTCSLGIHMVGYTMICLGVCGGLTSYISGLLTRLTGRIPLFIFASLQSKSKRKQMKKPDVLMKASSAYLLSVFSNG